jgi:hypothetical protein
VTHHPPHARPMTLEERRALVIKDIGDEDQARRVLVQERLKSRLVDFMAYLDSMEQDGAIIYLHSPSEPDGQRQDREEFVAGYIEEMLGHEDDPIGELAYCNP